MTDASDSDLLGQFARNGSETAFAALVERHLPLVYNGSLASLTNDPEKENNIAILRQREAWPTQDGKWARVYVSYARHVFVVESADNFSSWESQHLISPP